MKSLCKKARKLLHDFEKYEDNFIDFIKERKKIEKEMWERRLDPINLFNKLNEELIKAGFSRESVNVRKLPIIEENGQILFDFNFQYPEVLSENIFDDMEDFDEFYDEIFWVIHRINEMALKLENYHKKR